MFKQKNPLRQQAINQGQTLLAEVNRARVLTQNMVSTCDNIVSNINSGNTQNIINAVQNVRNMASQAAQATQCINHGINERLDMTSYALGAIQNRISEVSGVIQNLKETSANYEMNWNQYGGQQQGQYGTSTLQQSMQGQFGGSIPHQNDFLS